MSDPVIQVDSLWKKYRLGLLGTGTLRHDFNRWLHRIRGKPDPYAKVGETENAECRMQRAAQTSGSRREILRRDKPMLRDDEIWALQDISFELKQGEVLGIIGRNGAGKSTLLKILSRVTAPTSGEVRVKGRIASLLEVGTGFHPELTGRENIFLNGAILGMARAEVRQKLDEIVAFAEVEKFIDTPVKRYSSGMYVRLAFAVAAHLDPEILVVDEVLAVGDAQFQEKCLGKMKDAARGGRTVLFVSHNLGSIMALCSRCVLLTSGSVVHDSLPAEAVRAYVAGGQSGGLEDENGRQSLEGRKRRYRSEVARFLWISLRDKVKKPAHVFHFGDAMRIQLGYEIGSAPPLGVEVFIKTLLGEKVAYFPSEHFQGLYAERSGAMELVVPRLPLAEGTYTIDVGLALPFIQWLDFIEDAARFSVGVSDPRGNGFNFSQNLSAGSVFLDHEWTLSERSTAPRGTDLGLRC